MKFVFFNLKKSWRQTEKKEVDVSQPELYFESQIQLMIKKIGESFNSKFLNRIKIV